MPNFHEEQNIPSPFGVQISSESVSGVTDQSECIVVYEAQISRIRWIRIKGEFEDEKVILLSGCVEILLEVRLGY